MNVVHQVLLQITEINILWSCVGTLRYDLSMRVLSLINALLHILMYMVHIELVGSCSINNIGFFCIGVSSNSLFKGYSVRNFQHWDDSFKLHGL